MKFAVTTQKLAMAAVLAVCGSISASAQTNAPAPVSGRDFYNVGTKLLAAKKFADAEKMFLEFADARARKTSSRRC